MHTHGVGPCCQREQMQGFAGDGEAPRGRGSKNAPPSELVRWQGGSPPAGLPGGHYVPCSRVPHGGNGGCSQFHYCKYNNYEIKRGYSSLKWGILQKGAPQCHSTALASMAVTIRNHSTLFRFRYPPWNATLRLGPPWNGSNLLVSNVSVQQGLF